MDNRIIIYQKLAKEFESHGYKLFLVGGTVRDYLLGKELTDMDAVSDATPEQIIEFLSPIDKSFARFGSLKYKDESGVKFDITTLRKESSYLDNRHPSQIEFVKDLGIDYKRRDFTINAIYKDINGKIYDPSHGVDDLNSKIIRFIGDPEIRIKEDPLRILRAKRFAQKLGFEIEEDSLKAMEKLAYLLEKLNPDKIKEEERKSK